MATQSQLSARPAVDEIGPRRWVISLLMVGIGGSIGLGAQSGTSLAPLAASWALVIGAAALFLLRGSRQRFLVVSGFLAVGVVLSLAVSVDAASIAASAIAVVGLIAGPSKSGSTRECGQEGHDASNLHELLKSMAVASEIRDHQTADHCDRVSRNCRLIGEFLGLTERETTCLEWAARVHDVGKAAIPRRILNRPGPLSKCEVETVKHHSRLGADMLVAASEELATVARVVLHHHENWDGTGYPVGLSGLDIPLESRIIAVVDMYEALTSDRPYRAAMTAQDAHREVVTRSGSRFDPDVVVVFDELWRKGRLDTWARACRGFHGDQVSDGATPDGIEKTLFARTPDLLLPAR